MTTKSELACPHCQADQRMLGLIAGPALTSVLAGVAYAITGSWIVSPFGFGVGFAVSATVVVYMRRRWS
jgi:hypothetical protein